MKPVSRFPAGLVVLLVLLPPLATAQELLPGSFAGWNGSPLTTYEANVVEDLTRDHAAVLREYGVLRAERRSYARAGATLVVTLYRLRDPSGAFGAYSFLRSANMIPATISEHAALGPDRALAVVGNLVLEVGGEDLTSHSTDLARLAKQLAQRVDSGPYPTLWRYLPRGGLVSNSERYVLGPVALSRILPLNNGDWIGFGDGAEAQLARYRIAGGEATLLLASYPTPQAATRKLEEMAQWFRVNPAEALKPGRPTIYARRSGSLLALAVNADSSATAKRLLEQVQYEATVTWNEPGLKGSEDEFEAMLIAIFIGTGILLLFALVASLAFGGVRLLTKKLLPGKVFDRPDEMEILQLGLSSKPIEAKDFYLG